MGLLFDKVHATLGGLVPNLQIQEVRGRGVVISRWKIEVAQCTETAFRLLPDERWQDLQVYSKKDRPEIRRQVAQRLLLPDVGRARTLTPTRTHSAPRSSRGPQVEESGSLKIWVRALREFGVPAVAERGAAAVSGTGRLPIPSGPVDGYRTAASRFVREQTDRNAKAIEARIRRLLPGTQFELRRRQGWFEVHIGNERDARINRYVVDIRGREPIYGDVLAPDHALDAIRLPASRPATSTSAKSASAVTPGAPIAGRTLVDFPEDMSPRMITRALAASARLRTERRLVPAVTIEAATPQGTVRFAPVQTIDGALEVPFSYRRGSRLLAGALRLKRPSDPLALRVAEGSPTSLIGPAWAAALIVYSELTCAQLEENGAAPERVAAVAFRGSGAQVRPVGRRSSEGPGAGRRQTSPRRLLDPQSLERALRDLEAVAGHVRRLRPGHSASEEATLAAADAGIALPSGFTWVRPHRRGSDIVITVAWPRSVSLW